ncbi:MAG: UvrD-helicase domain-containing protein, partial [Bdellovibrionales bacterium]|nr:UvrD-helicase domain-containing protein [Bdellovibrionales bacterium]
MFDEHREISGEPTTRLESGAVLRAPLVRQGALFADLDVCPVAKKNPRLKPAAREALLRRVDETPFNPDQEQVVRHTLGPLRVNAGAGSGKTFVV